MWLDIEVWGTCGMGLVPPGGVGRGEIPTPRVRGRRHGWTISAGEIWGGAKSRGEPFDGMAATHRSQSVVITKEDPQVSHILRSEAQMREAKGVLLERQMHEVAIILSTTAEVQEVGGVQKVPRRWQLGRSLIGDS
jgi:hypothetical protein